MAKRQYPIEIRDVAPGPGAVRMTGKTVIGGLDGLHTGGAWLYQNKVWKPLDGRPYQNAQFHIETDEEACLKALQGKPLFPKNWEIAEANGRRFTVRDKVQTFPGGGLTLNASQVQEIEKGIREMNRSGWAVNDNLVIGRDGSGRLFIVDLSNASHSTQTGIHKPDDGFFLDELMKQAGFGEIVKLKKLAQEMRGLMIFNKAFSKYSSYRWIYSSKQKSEITGTVDVTAMASELNAVDSGVARQFSWYASKSELQQSVVRSKGLTLRVAG
jgi:hypothetical protein